MEVFRGVVVVLHLIAFAVLLGSWFVEALNKSVRFTQLMQWSMTFTLITGLALAAPWGTTISLNYFKIRIKLSVLLIIAALLGIGRARQRQGKQIDGIFWLVGPLVVADATIAVLV